MSKTFSDILIETIITEKSTLVAKQSKYTFKVSKDATKFQIRKSFESLCPKRKILAIQTVKIAGHRRRTKGGFKNPIDGKKAIVTIEGDRIEYFPESA